jgi:hypothetical protein
MLLVALMCGVSAGGCAIGQSAEPQLDVVGSSYYCGRVQFTITSATTVTPDWPDRPCNGNPPLAILDAGAMLWSEANSRTLTMPLRIVNRGTVPVQIPIRLILPLNGKTVLNPAETANSTMIPTNPDSTRADGTKVWLIGGTGTVGAGDSTAVRSLLFQINAPVIQGRFAFTITGETADTLPPAPPAQTAWPTTPLLVAPPYDTTLRYYRDVFGVVFDDTTSAHTINQFIASFAATVIGGDLDTYDAPYYILRVADPGPAWTAVDSVGQAMAARQGVYSAGPVCNVCKVRVRSRFPLEGQLTPTRGAWLDTTRADLWAWRAIRAPLAWGCETGIYDNNRIEIGLIDMFFHPNDIPSDLAPPLAAGGGVRIPTSANLQNATDLNEIALGQYHGHGVAGVMTATGDNGDGIAGMVWGSKLTAYTFGAFINNVAKVTVDAPAEFARHLKHAGGRGVRVMNFSGGVGSSFNTSELKNIRKAMKKFLDGSPSRLLVIATGNEGNPSSIALTISRASLAFLEHQDVKASDRVAAELLGDPGYRGKILFVTGVNRLGGRWSDPSGSANIWKDADLVAAPAEGVPSTMGTTGGGVGVFGATSIAAPFVSGLAAQIWSMKPTLTGAQVKDYILRGAETSPTPPAHMDGFQGIFRIDAYNSLKLLSAENTQTPLCGNRIFLNPQNRIQVQRSSPANLETIWQGVAGSDSIRAVYPYHGGRRLGMYSDSLGDQNLIFASGSWLSVPWTSSPPWALGGAWYSMRRTTHDGDSTVYILGTPLGSGTRLDVSRLHPSAAPRALASITVSHSTQSGDSQPVTRSAVYDTITQKFKSWSYGTTKWDVSSYEATAPWGGWGAVRGVPSPMGDRVFVLVNVSRFNFLGWGPNEGWMPTPESTVKDGHNTAEFRYPPFEVLSKDALIYSIPWVGGSATLVKQIPSRTIERMGVSEDGSEIVVAIGQFGSGTGTSYPYATCEFQYWGAGGSLPLKDSFPTVPHVCRLFNENAGGFSAVIAGMRSPGQPQMRPGNSLSTLFGPRAAQSRVP